MRAMVVAFPATSAVGRGSGAAAVGLGSGAAAVDCLEVKD